MRSQSMRYGHALQLEPGEDVLEAIRTFAASRGLRAGSISGLGAADSIELGFFDRASHDYVRRAFEGEYELGAVTGNLSELDGRPFPHLHAVIGGRDFSAWTGHLFRARITVSCELQLITDPGVMRRVSHPNLGFSPLQLDEGHSPPTA